MTSPAASRRDRWGKRYYPVPHPETKEIHDLPSWTGLKGQLHNGGIETWKLKNVAREVAMHPDLQMLAGDPDGEYTAVQQALDASRGPANAGTAIHRYAEYIDAGTLDWKKVPVAAKPWLQRYDEARQRFGWRMVETEVTVANLTLGYAGTADRFGWFPDEVVRMLEKAVHLDEGSGNVLCFDIKTGKSVWPETALQLGAYSSAEFLWTPPTDSDLPKYWAAFKQLNLDIAQGVNFKEYAPRARKWSEDAKKKAFATLDDLYWEEFAQWPGHRPLPEGLRTDLGVVALLHEDGCELVPLNLDGTIETVGALCRIWGWNQRGADVVGDPIGVTDGDSVDGTGSAGVSSLDSGRSSVGSGGPEPDSVEAPEEGPRQTYKEELASKPVTREWLYARIGAMPAEAIADVAANWPVDIPKLKDSTEHTTAQLLVIDGVLARIEAKHELPFVFKPEAQPAA